MRGMLLLANPTFQRHWIVWSHTMRNGVTTVGGTVLAETALAIRERSLSGSGWRVCEICGATQEMMHYNYRRGMQSIFGYHSQAPIQERARDAGSMAASGRDGNCLNLTVDLGCGTEALDA